MHCIISTLELKPLLRILIPVQDYERLLRELPNLVDSYTIPWHKYNHVDFLYAVDNNRLLYPRLLRNMAAAERRSTQETNRPQNSSKKVFLRAI